MIQQQRQASYELHACNAQMILIKSSSLWSEIAATLLTSRENTYCLDGAQLHAALSIGNILGRTSCTGVLI